MGSSAHRRQALLEASRERILLLDGAMGTVIQGYGLDEEAYRGSRFADHAESLAGANDLLSLTQPELIREIHERYLEAGADLIETNTFNANRISLTDYDLSEIAEERYYLKPTSGRQTFRIGYAENGRADDLEVSRSTPILIVNRYLHFTQAENAVYSALHCRTDRYVFSQTLGGASHG